MESYSVLKLKIQDVYSSFGVCNACEQKVESDILLNHIESNDMVDLAHVQSVREGNFGNAPIGERLYRDAVELEVGT